MTTQSNIQLTKVAKHDNISVPGELVPILEAVAQEKELAEYGITNKRALTLVIYSIILDRFERYIKDHPNSPFVKTSSERTESITIPLEMSRRADEVCKTRMARAMWLGEKPRLLARALPSMVAEYNKDYKEWQEIFHVTIDDIVRYVKKQRRKSEGQ